ncbi:ATP-dependent RNA helicase RhlB [invertebrate metagenome]|uniref:ATP-dependent RNA helicase RhlB n=1 Tax=invertebrate metagenome TaxID=1711999 RepID=A0A2H9TC67_9ZZZZ
MSGFLGMFSKQKRTHAGSEKISVRKNSKQVLPTAGKSARPVTTKQAYKKSARKPSGRRPHQNRKKDTADQWDVSQFDVEPLAGKKRFHDFALPEGLMHAIADQGFKYCTPIQAEVLESTLQGIDAIGKAQTGTGKTAAFLVSILKQLVDVPAPDTRYLGEPRAVIIAPTRELAMQISKDAQSLIRYLSFKVVTLVGGIEYDKQRKALSHSYVDILVATPGRLLDCCERKDVHLDLTEILVLDEADRMMDMGFIPQVRRIVRMTPRPGDRQTLLFSATFNDAVLRLGEQWTWHPVKVEIEPDHVAADNVEQKIYIVTNEQKFTLLVNLVHQQENARIMVFANRRNTTHQLAERLKHKGIRVDSISGDVAQNRRLKTLDQFRAGKIDVLVATDVAGRGIHVDGVTHVINYNLPEDPDDYIHRIGRTGRAGTTGTSISFASEDDSFLIPDLEVLLGTSLPKEYPPKSLCENI